MKMMKSNSMMDKDILKEIHESIEQEKRGEIYPWDEVREMLINEILQDKNNE